MKINLLICISLFSTSLVFCQNYKSIKGKVTNKKSIPLSNVIVFIQSGERTYTDSTDFYGMFYFDSLLVENNVKISLSRREFDCDLGYTSAARVLKEDQLKSSDTLKFVLSAIELEYNFPVALFKEGEERIYYLKPLSPIGVDSITNIIDTQSVRKIVKLINCDYSLKLLIRGNVSETEAKKGDKYLGYKRAESLKKIFTTLGVAPSRIIIRNDEDKRLALSEAELNKIKNVKEKEFKTFSNRSAIIEVISR